MRLLSRLTGLLPASLHILIIFRPLSAVPLINAPDTTAEPQYWGMPGWPGAWRGVPGTDLLFSEWMHLLAGGLGGGNEASQA